MTFSRQKTSPRGYETSDQAIARGVPVYRAAIGESGNPDPAVRKTMRKGQLYEYDLRNKNRKSQAARGLL